MTEVCGSVTTLCIVNTLPMQHYMWQDYIRKNKTFFVSLIVNIMVAAMFCV